MHLRKVFSAGNLVTYERQSVYSERKRSRKKQFACRQDTVKRLSHNYGHKEEDFFM